MFGTTLVQPNQDMQFQLEKDVSGIPQVPTYLSCVRMTNGTHRVYIQEPLVG